MLDNMDGGMWASAEKMSEWKEDLFFAMYLAHQQLPKYYAAVIPTTHMLLIQ
jgi:hypothetical protein